jgi:DNA mismatch repair protein MutL
MRGCHYGKPMPEIRILPDRVANQIAAGEVVERPVAVVKELIENSIDAGAGKIEIEFRNGGKSYLRVEDDGRGMNPDQALLSLERHATSKIRKASDLHEVQTFGFRGEALPSISSVSRFTLRTRAKGSKEGNEIFVNGGKMIHVKECGMPQGTRVEVSHLFNSVPGRRKFLKTDVTEAAHIIHMSKLYALAHPSITFSLVEGGRTLFRSPACKDFLERVREIFGKGLAECLVPIENTSMGLKLEGLIGKPGQSRSTRKEMMFFVNRRPVESKTISYAVLEAYHTYAPKGRFPPAILFLSIDPGSVDVNIHPAKREIRFRDERKIRLFLLESILERNKELAGQGEDIRAEPEMERDFSSGMLVPKMDPHALELHQAKPQGESGQGGESGIARQPEAEIVFPRNSGPDGQPGEGVASAGDPARDEGNSSFVGLRQDVSASWRFLDRPHGDVAIFSTPQGVVALHCRAAYERIRFEQLEASFVQDEKKINVQSLLLPESLELDGIDSALLDKGREDLKKAGFALEEFGRNFYRLEGCPAWISPEEAVGFLRDFLEIARENGGEMNVEAFAKETLIRSATKNQGVHKDFSDEEVVRMANQLVACGNPYTCPQGRPTYFEIPKREFESRFRRKL